MTQLQERSTNTPAVPQEAIEAFAGEMRGQVLCEGDPGYEEARLVFNAMYMDRRPAIVAKCRGTADVVDAVNFGREHGLTIAVRGGGHSIAGFSTCDGGLLIDLSEMRGVHVDPEARIAQVQGGATWADVDRETQLHALATPGGVISTTGVGGLTLGGGIGWLRNKYGLSCDNVRSFELVTAEGQVVRASAEQNSDLYWALRGGGGNFGIVTSFEFQLHPVGPILHAFLSVYALDDAPAVLRRWRDWVLTAPDEVTSAAFLQHLLADHPGMPPELQGQRILMVAAVHCGDPAEAKPVIAPLKALGEPIADLTGDYPYRVLQSLDDEAYGAKGRLSGYWKSTYLPAMRDEAIDIMVERFRQTPSPGSVINIPHMAGAYSRVGPTETAYGSREAPFMVSADALWTDPAETAANIAWSRTTWDLLQPYATGQVFANFTGAEEGDAAESLVHGVYRDNYERLVDVKTKYDPTNLFRLNQNIKPRA